MKHIYLFEGKGASPVCKTLDVAGDFNADPGKVCVFPFTYHGVTYSECTMDGMRGHFWCATELDAAGEVPDNKWGECGSSCLTPGILYSS